MPRYAVVRKLPRGGSAIVCIRHACQVCGERLAAYQCDAVVAKGKTCDKYLCEHCRRRAGPNLDFCPPHAALEENDA